MLRYIIDMIEITLGKTLQTIENLRRSAQAFLHAMQDRREVLEKIKRRQISRWARNFDTQGSIYGPWPALSPSWTIPERRSEGYGAGPKLIRDGYLRAHFVRSNNEGQVTNQAVQWNFQNKYDAWIVTHHEGMPNPLPNRKPIPARPLWDLDPEDEDAMVKIMDDWVDDIVKRYFS